jgi:hypothetical protein
VCACDKRIYSAALSQKEKRKRDGKMTQKKNKVSEKHFGWLLSEINGSWRHGRRGKFMEIFKVFFCFTMTFSALCSICLLSESYRLRDFQLMVFDLWGDCKSCSKKIS